MKKFIFIGVLGLFVLGACNSTVTHTHNGHDHEAEGHNHATESHNHAAEGHEGHDHEAEGHDHSAHGGECSGDSTPSEAMISASSFCVT